jgi:putative flippase GtrA
MTWLREMLRYGIKGGAAVLANAALMALLVELGGLQPAVAAMISTCSLLTIGYVVTNRWVFGNHDGPNSLRAHARRGVAYYAVILSGKGLNYLVFLGLLRLQVWYPLAWVLGAVVAFGFTFTGNRRLWAGEVMA